MNEGFVCLREVPQCSGSLQAFVATGTNIQLVFNPSTNGYSTADHGRECDFDKEHGKVSYDACHGVSS
jgi:hypothetical protein